MATAASRTSDEDTALAVDLAALVSDVETADADLTYTIVTGPAHGSSTARRADLHPDADYNGPDSFTYRVTDRGDPDNCGAPGPACDGAADLEHRDGLDHGRPGQRHPDGADATRRDEDAAAGRSRPRWSSDVETADANLAYNSVTGPAHGTLSGGGGTGPTRRRPTTTAPTASPTASPTAATPTTAAPPGRPATAPDLAHRRRSSITVDAVNDAPVNVLPAGPITALQDTDTPLTGIAVTDVDAGVEPSRSRCR